MNRIVVDLGCQDYGHQDSLAALVTEYKPARIYGFDPSPLLDETVTQINGCPAQLRRAAAWLYDGTVPYQQNGTRSALAVRGVSTPCFDFSAWLRDCEKPVVVKMDVEGAEYELLDRLIADGTDARIEELVIEWHGDGERAEMLTRRLACPVREWWL